MSIVFCLLLASSPVRALEPTAGGAALSDGRSAWDFDVAWQRAEVIERATPSSKRTARSKSESLRTLTGRLARSFAAWHVGAALQLADRDRADARSTALSQGAVNGGWSNEMVTSFAQLTLPVSRSAYELADTYQLGALGRGFWALGLGQFWHFDHASGQLFASYEFHHSFDRGFTNPNDSGYLEPGWGFNWMAGIGGQLGKASFTFSVAQVYEDPVAVHGKRDSRGGSAQRFFQVELGASWALTELWSLGVSWADQTLLPAANADLLRQVGVTLAGHWD